MKKCDRKLCAFHFENGNAYDNCELNSIQSSECLDGVHDYFLFDTTKREQVNEKR